MTRNSVREGEERRVAAASRYRWSTSVRPARVAAMKNGAATNTCATTTASVVKGIERPNAASAAPASPCLPNASSNPTPATVGGSTMGSSSMVSISRLPGKVLVASRYAIGRPSSVTARVAATLVSRLSRRASRSASSRSRSSSSAGRHPEPRGRRREGRAGRRAPRRRRRGGRAARRSDARPESGRSPSQGIVSAGVSPCLASTRRPSGPSEQRRRTPCAAADARACRLSTAIG